MFRQPIRLFVALVLLGAGVGSAAAQSLDVTFRYVPQPGEAFVRAFLPGGFNGWGPNSGGIIAPGAPSLMTLDAALDQWLYTIPLSVGQTYQYKIHLHFNQSGTDNQWLTDPLNPISNPADNNNSVLTVANPMVFQMARRENDDGAIIELSAGIFGTAAVTALTFEVNGAAQDGLPFFDAATGLFRYELPVPVVAGSQFKLTATDAQNRTAEAEVGEILAPVRWVTPDFSTFRERFTVEGSVTRLDGTVDPGIVEATLRVNGQEETVAVADGLVRTEIGLNRGENELVLRADVEGTTFTSETLLITRRPHPLTDALVSDVAVGGSDNTFQIDLTLTDEPIIPELIFVWLFDEANSTADLVSGGPGGSFMRQFNGTASGPGELYFDVLASETAAADPASGVLERRVAVIVEEDGTARSMRYEETPAWVNQAVVYEIFPFSFGPTEARGTPQNPGRRFTEITAALDYLAAMGFTVLWFMPVMHNQIMNQNTGGYSIIDFYNVDPTLGTNDDFKALIDRAHELGLKVILDITPSHVAPAHPWVESVREQGAASPFFGYLQTEPSPHDRGLDGRGPNLPEVWQTEGGRTLYRKYQGFGDLANLNWDDDDLQATFLDVVAHWVREFDIDGWRFDVYWGPWRRYGPERFGRPIRDLMKRLKPDSWILSEIAGTGTSTEVYYADDDQGTPVVGGIDAGYDWRFYFEGIRANYGVLGTYDHFAHNGDFWPGPNARYFRFLENHDEERIARRFRTTPERILPLTGFLLTTTGVPMIYQGQEVNFGDVPGDGRRVPVDWETPRNAQFAGRYQQLAQARTQLPAFWTQRLHTLNTTNSVYAYVRPLLDANAVVLTNFSDEARTLSIDPTPFVEMTTDGPVPYTHLWADSTFFDSENDGFEVTVRAYETLIFITTDDVDFTLPSLPALPFGAVYTGTEEAGVPQDFRLEPAYPNPFNPVTTIRYAVPVAGPVRLDVFDVLGRRVAVLADGFHGPGAFEVVFDAGPLPSGLYLYRLRAGHRVETKTMVLVR